MWFILFSMILLSEYNNSYASIYYVKTNGNDTNTGINWSNAWQTIKKATSTMSNGDITYVSNGIYNETDIYFSKSGNSSNYISLIAYNPLKVTINSYGTYCFNIDLKNYIYISGFILRKAGTGIKISRSDFCIITNCKIIDNDRGIHIIGDTLGYNDPATNNTIINCSFSNNTNNEAIFLDDRERYNVIKFNTMISNYNGISWGNGWADPPLVNYIISNYISHNSGRGLNLYLSFVGGKIYGNTINSNNHDGIYFQEVGKELIISNNIIIGNNYSGVRFVGSWGSAPLGDKYFFNNLISKNYLYGINVDIRLGWEDAKNVILKDNIISFNNSGGIYFKGDNDSSVSNAYIYNNKIYNNGAYGIYLEPFYKYSYISQNEIYNHKNNIYVNTITNIVINSNKITKATNGLYINNSYNIEIVANNITNNKYGIINGNNDLILLTKNNLIQNKNYAISNISGNPFKMTNNWWGTTIASSIQSNLYGITGYSNFIPYRLFGKFHLKTNSDITPPDRIQYLLSTVSEETVKLIWNKSTNSDFKRYSIYRSSEPGFTNLSRLNVITNIYDINITNYNDLPGEGTWYYSITSLDKYNIYTNESWYSHITNATIIYTTIIKIEKSISNITVNNIENRAIPGSSILFKINISNKGKWDGKNVIIYDKIMKNTIYATNLSGSATNWICEFSTNNTPLQSYISPDYTPAITFPKYKIKWIRWKKNLLFPYEDGIFLLYKSIIK